MLEIFWQGDVRLGNAGQGPAKSDMARQATQAWHAIARRDLSGTGSTLSGMAGRGNAGGASQRRTPCGAASLRSSRIGMAMQARSGPVGSGLARFVAVGSVAAMQAWRGLAHTGEARLDVLWRCMSSQRPARRGNAGGVARCWDRFAPVRQGDAGAASCSNATRGIVGHGNAGVVGLVAARSGTFGSGFAVSGTARRGDAGLVRLGLARLGSTERGAVGRRRHGTARRGRSGQCEIEPDRASHGWAMQARRVRASVEGHRPERRRTARQPRLGCVLPVSARHDLARQRRRSNARQVLSRHGPFLQRSKRHGNAGSVRAMIGNAGYRWVLLGVATQAEPGVAWAGKARQSVDEAGMARLSMTGQRDAAIGEAGGAGLCKATVGATDVWNGIARLVNAGMATRGIARSGLERHVSAVRSQAWLVKAGMAQHSCVCHRNERHGNAGSGTAGRREAMQARSSKVRRGSAGHRSAVPGNAGMERLSRDWQCRAAQGDVWNGIARRGNAGLARQRRLGSVRIGMAGLCGVRQRFSMQACIENSVARRSDSVSTFYAPPLLLKENG